MIRKHIYRERQFATEALANEWIELMSPKGWRVQSSKFDKVLGEWVVSIRKRLHKEARNVLHS